MFDFAKAAEAADRAAAAGTLQEEQAAVYAVLKYREEIQIALTNVALAKCSGPMPKHERLPLRDENGDDYGEVLARVPKALFFGLRNQKNFGEDGFTDDGGLKDLLKAFPACRVKTVSGRTTVGWRAKAEIGKAESRNLKRRFRFDRGTLQLAT